MIGSNQRSSQIIEHGSDREELPREADWRQRKWLAMGELLVVALMHAAGDLIYDPQYLGVQRSERFVLVHITLSAGRKPQQKRKLFKRMAEILA